MTVNSNTTNFFLSNELFLPGYMNIYALRITIVKYAPILICYLNTAETQAFSLLMHCFLSKA